MPATAPRAPRVLLSGIDTMVGASYEPIAPRYELALDTWKRQAQTIDPEPLVVTLAGEAFRVEASGDRSFPYRLTHARGQLKVRPDTGNSRRPTVHVQMYAEALHG